MKKLGLAMGVVLITAGLLFGCGSSTKGELQAKLDYVDVMEVEGIVQIDGMDITVQYPEISTDNTGKAEQAVVEKLNGLIQRDLEAYCELLEKQGTDANGSGRYYYVSEVAFNQKGQLSIVRYIGLGAETRQYADTYRLDDGERATLGDVMGMSEKEAVNTVQKMLAGVYQSDPETFYPDSADIMKKQFGELQYYRSGEGMGAFFQAGVVAPVEKGVLEIVIG